MAKERNYSQGRRDVWYHFDRAIDIADRGLGTAVKHAGPLGAIAALINIEKKWYDSGVSNLTPTAGIYATYAPTVAITQGDGAQQVLGNSVKLLSLFLRLNLIPHSTETSGQCLRIIVVIDWDANGAAPTLADVLATVSVTNGDVMMSPLNKATSFASGQPARFKVLSDEVHELIRDDGTSYNNKYIDYYWDQKKGLGEDHHMLWSADAHATGNILGGHPFIFAAYVKTSVSTGAPTYAFNTTNPPGLQVYTRIRYTDD